MAILWLILKIVLGILGVLLVLLVAGSLCSITIQVEQREELFVQMRYLFWKRQLLPEEPEEQPEHRSLDQKAEDEFLQLILRLKDALVENAKILDFQTVLSLILEAICDVLDPSKKILAHLRIHDLTLHLSVGAGDAAQTAIRYGQVSAAFYNLLALLQRHMTVKVRQVRIDANYLSGKIEARYSFAIKLRMGVAAWQLLRAGNGLMNTRTKLEAAKERASHRKEESYGSSN